MKISKQARRGAKQLFRACFVNGLLDEQRVRDTVKSVLNIKPRGFLAIVSQFERLVKLAVDQRTARIESATPLPLDLQATIQADLARSYGPGLHFSFAQNPALIGGLRIKVGCDVYDGSIQGRLAALNDTF